MSTLGLSLSAAAAFASTLGGVAVYHPRLATQSALGAGLAAAAGAMLLVSAQLIEAANAVLADVVESSAASQSIMYASLFAGVLGTVLVQQLAMWVTHRKRPETQPIDGGVSSAPFSAPPSSSSSASSSSSVSANRESVHRSSLASEESQGDGLEHKLRVSMWTTTVALAAHNIPEGMVTVIAATADPHVGVAVAVAIALHNIPEGLAVALQVVNATGSKLHAVTLATVAGVAEFVGGLVAFLLLRIADGRAERETQIMVGIFYALAAGIMLLLVVHELLPMARRAAPERVVLLAFWPGVAIVAFVAALNAL